MKKILSLLMVLAIAVPLLRAQNPDAIYVHNVTGATVTEVTSSNMASDTKLTYNESTGTYDGKIFNWLKMVGGSDTNAKYFYSISGDVITYYGLSTAAIWQLTTNNTQIGTSKSFSIISSDQPSGIKGLYYMSNGSTAVSSISVSVSLNLEDSNITFTFIEPEEKIEIPTLESIEPANNSTVTPDSNGDVTIKLTFSGKVDSLEALVDGTDINASEWGPNEDSKEATDWENNISSNDDGTVWTLIVPKELISQGTNEDGGKLQVKVGKIKCAGGYVADQTLNYIVAGISTTATLNFEGSEEALKDLTVYKSAALEEEDVQYIVGTDNVTFSGNSYTFPFTNKYHFLFIAEGYEINVTSTAPEGSWSLGTAWAQKVIIDEGEEGSDSGTITYENVAQGVELNILSEEAKDAIFTVNLVKIPSSIYISGSFNDYNPNESSEWAINLDADILSEDGLYQYPGTLEIPEGNISFNFSFDGGKTFIIPSDNQTITPEFDNSEYAGTYKYGGNFITSTSGEAKWQIENWEGGEFGIFIDWDNKSIQFSYDVELPEVWYIRCKQNDYNPNYNQEWALNPAGEDENGDNQNGVYTGTFNIAAGELSFNLLSDVGVIWLPVSLHETEIQFKNNSYSDGMEYYFEEGDELIYWTYPSWEGGEITITVDTNTGKMTVTIPSPEVPSEIYISGMFNANNPDGDSTWKLVKDEDNEYKFSGYFEIPEGQCSFNFVAGDKYYSPKGNNEIEFVDNVFTGSFIEGESNEYWSDESFEGGEFGVLLDFESMTFTFQYTPQEVADVWYIRGAFNEYDPQGEAEWALTPAEEDDENGVYTGKFTAAQGEMSFNLVGPSGMIFIPASLESENIIFEASDDGGVIFEGNMGSAQEDGDENIYWTCSDWAGGEFTVTVDANEGTITITASEESTIVNALNKFTEDDAIYNLQGVKVSNPVKGGIYIINGKKVLVK